MVSTFTPNIQLEIPARGDDVGTWDTPIGNDLSLTDLVVGGIATIGLNNSPVVLASAQFQSAGITFNSTLTGSVAITFPSTFKKPYTVGHLCTGSSAFTITLQTTVAGGQAICCPPGEFVDVFNDGTNLKFRNLGRVGSYWDDCGSSVPNWVSGCTVPPYLNCDGTSFSSATYPVLTMKLGGTTLPDSKGRVRMALDQSAGRVSSAFAGFSPNTVGAGGGSQAMQAHSHNLFVTDPGHFHSISLGDAGVAATAGQGVSAPPRYINLAGSNTDTKTTGITVTASAAGSGTTQNIQPTFVGGLCLIRAA